MDIREICAEKIRAMSGGARYRDFYDFYLITEQYAFDMDEIYKLLEKKEVRKVISTDSILENRQLAKEAKTRERQTVYYKAKVVDHDDDLEAKLKSLSFTSVAVNSVFSGQ
jgi:predicted nucleotidyltransferase component of viral defense system